MKVKEITSFFESIAPTALQESYDNCGLIVGEKNMNVSGVLFTLDCTEDVIDEAIQLGFNLVVAHHPIIFSGLKKINGKNYVERTVIKAIKNDIAIYAAHTNYDNIIGGVNSMIAEKIGHVNYTILSTKSNALRKIITYCPTSHAEAVRTALSNAGAGNIGNYSHCSFNIIGQGTFMANEKANPLVGEIGKLHVEEEVKVEMVYPFYLEENIKRALLNAHPYEEVAFDIFEIQNQFNQVGSGLSGEFETEISEHDFLGLMKETFKVPAIKHTKLLNKKIKKVGLCGGSGSFLLSKAISSGCDVYLSSDFKYHEFFDAEDKILIVDIGHYETEQFTPQLFYNHFIKIFSTFAARLSKVNTNPVNYF